MKFKAREMEKRREFMKGLILKDPTMAGSKLNAMFEKQFGDKMRINSVYDLKEELGYDRKGNPKNKSKAQPVVSAGRAPGDGMSVFPMMVSLEEGDTPLGFTERVLEQLKSQGVINLEVTGKSERWIVLEPAP